MINTKEKGAEESPITDTTRAALGCPVCRLLEQAQGSRTVKHLKNARREMLLALKALIEAGIEHLEKQPDQESETAAHKVDIQ